MSGTVESAGLAAKESPVRTEVVDSRSHGMGLGFAVLAAARAASSGATVGEVAEAARARAESSTVVFYVDTLEHLRRGGRIGAASALLGSALAVKPLLHLVDGQIQPLEKVRTAARAISRLEELAVERARDAPVDVAVHHLANADRAGALAERLRARLPGIDEMVVSEVGAVVGAHVGPAAEHDGRAHALGRGLLERLQHALGGHHHDGQIHLLRDRADRRERGQALHRGARGIDRVDGPGVAVAQQEGERPATDLDGIVGGAHDRDGARPEDSAEAGHGFAV
jgi:hypothetical protein